MFFFAACAIYFSYKYEKEKGKEGVLVKSIDSEQKLEREKENYTDMMVHELRAPLTALRGAAALLLSNTLPPQEKEKMPRIILDSSNDMLSTISDFLDIAKIDEGKFKVSKAKSDLISIISEHVEVFSYPAREKNIKITFDKDTVVPQFFFDPLRVGQVVNNLLSNSIKFTDPGGAIDIKVEVLKQNPLDGVKGGSFSALQGGQILVTVTDNGIGIPEGKKPLLFTKFGQIDQGSNRGASSGLGLFISREIIDAHGGKIWLESQEGHGTRAYFTLPVILGEERSAEETAIGETVEPPIVQLAN